MLISATSVEITDCKPQIIYGAAASGTPASGTPISTPDWPWHWHPGEQAQLPLLDYAQIVNKDVCPAPDATGLSGLSSQENASHQPVDNNLYTIHAPNRTREAGSVHEPDGCGTSITANLIFEKSAVPDSADEPFGTLELVAGGAAGAVAGFLG